MARGALVDRLGQPGQGRRPLCRADPVVAARLVGGGAAERRQFLGQARAAPVLGRQGDHAAARRQGAQRLREHVAPLHRAGRRQHGGDVEAVLGQILEPGRTGDQGETWTASPGTSARSVGGRP